MTFVNDLIDYIGSLSLTEIWFFMVFMLFLIAIVTLVYVLKSSDEEINAIGNVIEQPEKKKIPKKEKIEPEVVSVQEEIKPGINLIEEFMNHEETEEEKKYQKELDTIKEITKNLEQYDDSSLIDLTEFENDQEEKAIISYEELLKHKDNLQIVYDNDYYDDEETAEISIKKIDMNKKENVTSEVVDDNKKKPEVISYEQEESFLATLKQLQGILQ